MHKGIYIALSAAVLKNRNMDIFAQNIANTTTPGYKKERMSFKEYLIPVDNKPPQVTDGRTMVQLSDHLTDFSFGSNIRTDNPFDLAINGEGFFALENNRYTRNGSFKIDDDGYLATKSGERVLGSGGPITVQGRQFYINESGEVFVDDVSAGTIRVVDFPDKQKLSKVNGGLFTSDDSGEEVKTTISQGYLEESNVDAVKELIEMLTTLREFESYQKAIHMFDEAAARVNNELGK